MFNVFSSWLYHFRRRRQIANCSIVFTTFFKKTIWFKTALSSQKLFANCDIRFFNENFQSLITLVDDEYKFRNIFNCHLIMLIIDQQFKDSFDVKDVKYTLNFDYSTSRAIFWFRENQLNLLKWLNVALILNWNWWRKKFIVARRTFQFTINNELIMKREWRIFLKCFFESNSLIEWIWSEH